MEYEENKGDEFQDGGGPIEQEQNIVDGAVDEDPYQGDDQTYQEHFRKTFITENQKKMMGGGPEETSKAKWTLHDMIIPAGKKAKLIRIKDPNDPDFRISEICDKIKFVNPAPVIILAGAMTQRAGKVLAGACRAAFRTDAYILDSGIGSGIEKFSLRKNVNLVGVCPEAQVTYPRINPANRKDNELTNGHTHFFLIGDEQKKFSWGDEVKLKLELAQRITIGRSKFGGQKPCKTVCLVLGDNPGCYKEIQMCMNQKMPIVVLEGSTLTNDIIQGQPSGNRERQEVIQAFSSYPSWIQCRESSEDLASIVHLMLAVTLF